MTDPKDLINMFSFQPRSNARQGLLVLLATGLTGTAAAIVIAAVGGPELGSDLNSTDNAFVQPQDPALSGGGRDQTLQFGDVLRGDSDPAGDFEDLLIGRLGSDVLLGGDDDDVLLGGTEHFNPMNRDRAFGEGGEDVFVWAPGDGSDFFDGGPGIDVVIFGLVGEVENGQTVFRVSNDQMAGDVFIDPVTGLPQVDVTNSPGFCEIIDDSSSALADVELDDLGLDHLVRFSIRGIRNAFEAGQQTTDNGVRVTLHLKDVEVLICTSRSGGQIEAFNLTTSPPTLLPLNTVFDRLPKVGDLVR